MKSKLELCSMIYETYMAAFLAGSRCDDEHIAQARDKRDELLYAVKFMCNELDDLSRDYEQLEEDMCRECDNLRDQVRSQQETIRKLTLTDPENPDSPSWSDFAPGPEDMEPELRDCLPFPDVDDLAPASELLGGDE